MCIINLINIQVVKLQIKFLDILSCMGSSVVLYLVKVLGEFVCY